MNDSATRPTGLDIKLARIRGGIRQYELAAAVGIAPQRLLLIENGRLPASERFFRRLLQLIEGWPERGREHLGLYGRLFRHFSLGADARVERKILETVREAKRIQKSVLHQKIGGRVTAARLNAFLQGLAQMGRVALEGKDVVSGG